MHPLAATSYPRRVTVTPTRSSRRRARRAAIAVVAGLLGAGAGQAYADPPQLHSHQHLPGSHANVHRHTGPGSLDAPADSGSLDAWPGALIVVAAGALGAGALARRHRAPTAT